MLENFGYIALFTVISILFASLLVFLPVLLRLIKIIPSKPNPIKYTPFECGMETIGRSWVQFNFRYYFYALMLIALDVMVVFLYPWAVDLKQLGEFGFFVVLIFISIVVIGYIYAWRKKVLEWK
ncbi:MAG TPA: NADH-quinone oxidoreductase subunit A [Dehalococcoidia bacterium]|nr:NADH-quinone oxidoreductase subunit A [Dehalococcoidia bacterium]